ncbi:MAG TPA: ATP-dependent helicase C-terminal domain-containing protein, partial [Gemmatimonadaceae bacterium]
YAQARELLVELEALDASGQITSRGETMAALPTHPRLAHMLVHARASNALRVGAELAALLSERDVFRSFGPPIDADVALRVEAIHGASVSLTGAELDREALRRVRGETDRLERQLGAEKSRTSDERSGAGSIGALLALAYPDRIAQRRPGERARYLLRNGRGAELVGAQMLSESSYIVAAALDDRRPESRVFLATSLELSELRSLFADQIVTEDVVEFDDTTEAVIARRRERLGAITLRDVDLASPSDEQIRNALLAAIRKRGVATLPWPESVRKLRERIAFAASHDQTWPDVSDGALEARLEEWLAPMLSGVRRLSQIERVDMTSAIASLLDWKQRRALDELAPTHIEVPTGSRIPVDYADPAAPSLAVRIQEVFGLTESPRIMAGRVPITMELLSPAHRPVQVTRDLSGFWRTSYFDVRKDLRGRYPKHEWPEDPINATPTRRAKPHGK